MLEPTTKKDVIAWWLVRGFALLPCQANTKFLFGGYGEYQKKIVTQDEAEAMFRERSKINLAVCASPGSMILDFDDAQLYEFWSYKHPEIAKTYTERTPRKGAHVFLFGTAPRGIVLVPGVEVKKVCVIAPSVVNGISYTRGAGEIIEANATEIFSSLSKIGTRSAYVLQVGQHQHKERHQLGGKIEQIKNHYDIMQVFGVYRPNWHFEIKGQIASGLCPFHDDHRASLFVLLDKQWFRCHACDKQGDVINLYAEFEGITNAEAVARMWASMQGVRA